MYLVMNTSYMINMLHDLKTMIENIHKLSYITSNEQKKNSIIVIISMIFSSALELLGVSVIYPFLEVMTGDSLNEEKWYVCFIRRFNPNITSLGVILFISVAIILIYLVKNGISLYCSYIQLSFSERFNREMSTLMLESYLKRPYEFFVNHSTAEIIRGVKGDTSQTYQIMQDLFEFLSAFLTVVMISLYLIKTDWVVTICALMLAGICFLMIVLGFKKKMKKVGIELLDATTQKYKYSIQAISAAKEIFVTDRRDSFISIYEDSARVYENVSLLSRFLAHCPDRILEGVCIGGFIGIAAIRMAMGGDANSFVPVMGTFAMGAFKILPSVSKMSNRINDIVCLQPSLYNCYDNIKEAKELEITRSNRSLESANKENDKCPVDSLKFKDSIVLKDVSWKYLNSQKCVLEGLTLSIKKGESIALIGESGAGKTTLADIILGLYKPQEGSITMDGKDIFRIPHVWAKTIGYVPQSVFLVDGTVRANVAFGLSPNEYSDDKIWDALEQARLADFIRSLPDGLDAIVGERGIKFSGGQRQRVAIARALYDNPEILILDEATSALDTGTETAVMESIEALLGKKTLIIIAHRLSTIKNCDNLYEIKDGKAIIRDRNSFISEDMMK